VCPCVIVWRQTPLNVSQTLIDWSLEQEIRKSGWVGMKAIPETSCSCPWIVLWAVKRFIFQSLIYISVAQDASTVPCWLKARNFTIPECPFSVRSCSPYSNSHSLMVASSDAEAAILYLGCKTTLVILARWPCKVYFSGSLGRPSPGLNEPPLPPPKPSGSYSHLSQMALSFICLIYFSRSQTCFFRRANEVHFFSKISILLWSVVAGGSVALASR
jgi:hypothetical protein